MTQIATTNSVVTSKAIGALRSWMDINRSYYVCNTSAHITDSNRGAESLMGRFATGFANRTAFLGKILKSVCCA